MSLKQYQTIAPRGARPFPTGIVRRPSSGPTPFDPEPLGNLLFWGESDGLDNQNGAVNSWANSAAIGGSIGKFGNTNVNSFTADGFVGVQFPSGLASESGYFSGNFSTAIGSSGFHAFLVCIPFNNDTTDQSFFTYGTNPTGGNQVYAYYGNPALKLNTPSATYEGDTPAPGTAQVRKLIEFVWNPSNEIQFFQNNVEITDGGSPPGSDVGSVAGTDFYMGTDGTFSTLLYGSSWQLFEFLFYAGGVSDPAAVRTYLIDKFLI